MVAWRAEVAMEAAVKAAAVGLGRWWWREGPWWRGEGWEAAVEVAVVVAVEVAVVVAARVGVVAAEEGSAGWETAEAVVAVRDSEAVWQVETAPVETEGPRAEARAVAEGATAVAVVAVRDSEAGRELALWVVVAKAVGGVAAEAAAQEAAAMAVEAATVLRAAAPLAAVAMEGAHAVHSRCSHFQRRRCCSQSWAHRHRTDCRC